MTDDIKPGSGGRPPGCLYYKEDHERAAAHVRKEAPQVFEWIEAHPEGLPPDVSMHQLMWRTAMEILPKATLVDHAQVGLILRLQADPPSPEARARLNSLKMRRKQRWQ